MNLHRNYLLLKCVLYKILTDRLTLCNTNFQVVCRGDTRGDHSATPLFLSALCGCPCGQLWCPLSLSSGCPSHTSTLCLGRLRRRRRKTPRSPPPVCLFHPGQRTWKQTNCFAQTFILYLTFLQCELSCCRFKPFTVWSFHNMLQFIWKEHLDIASAMVDVYVQVIFV